MNLSAIIQAARPKTLPAAVVPVWLGCSLAWMLSGKVSWWLALCTLMGAIFIQIATNFFNDAVDSDKGADTENRIGPRRVTASGQMSRAAVYAAAFTCLVLASVFGLFMMLERGWLMLLIGIPSFYLSYGYTGGPLPLAYRGLGELFVLIFFGWIAVIGTVFVQLGTWNWESLLLGTQVGLLSAVLISVNNIRDHEEDSSTGKNTLVVLWGRPFAVKLLWLMTLLPYCLGALWMMDHSWLLTGLPFLAIPLGLKICRKVSLENASSHFNKYLALAALQLILFGGFWFVALLLS